jgi:hypothetical protein
MNHKFGRLQRDCENEKQKTIQHPYIVGPWADCRFDIDRQRAFEN